ncbi:rRNA maturation RNase YbeY [Helicobacter sp. 23-1045]
MILFDNRTDFEINSEILDLLKSIAQSVTNGDIELLLVSDDEIRGLNAEFLGRDYATDVLSFPLDLKGADSANLPLGSIAISLHSAESSAVSHKHSLQTELAILFTHGLLHLLGYNHECDDGEHRAKENEILQKFGITSLIERNA